jgi:serine/threonine protein kinase
MLAPYGETLVLDWGLAKRFGGDDAMNDDGGEAFRPGTGSDEGTATGEVLGTPLSMSPEQARGEPAGPAGDTSAWGWDGKRNANTSLFPLLIASLFPLSSSTNAKWWAECCT